jgi:hypothetical protein
MKNFLILATMLLTFGFTHSQSSNPFNGVWTGQGYQLNNNDSWSIKLTIKNNSAYIEYPSLECSGKCTIISKSENELILKEKISNGNCVNNGRIQLKIISDDKISFKWAYPNGDPGATGTLTRFY